MAVDSWSQSLFCGSALPGTRTLEIVAALPSTVTVKAEAGGGLDNCRSSEKSRLIISPSASSILALVSVGGVVSAATWKTAESPYMGRVLAVPVTALLLRGPWRALEELGRPTFVPPAAPNPCEMEPSSASVPLCPQPVKGRLTDWEVSGPLVPDSFLSLTSSSQDPS